MPEINEDTLRTLTKDQLRDLSILVSRSQAMVRAGLTYAGARDMYAILGYPRVILFKDYWDAYCRGDIAKRVVDAPAQATWRLAPKFIAPEAPSNGTDKSVDEFNTEWNKLVKRLRIMHILERADKMASIGRYGVLLTGTRGNALDKQATEVPKGINDVLYLSVFSEDHAKITELEDDPKSERFGLPKMYELTTSSNIPGLTDQKNFSGTVNVHHSHTVHIAEGLMEDDVFGLPKLQPIFNLLLDLAKVSGGAAEMFWINANRGMQLDIDSDSTLTPDDKKDMEEEMDDFFHGLRRFVRTRGATMNNLGSDIADPRGVFNVIVSLISGTTGIPQRILVGSERGQLASTQDRNNWNERILERQKNFAEPVMLRPFVTNLTKINALPELPDGYGVEWPAIQVMTPQEEAETAARAAQAIRGVSMQEEPVVDLDEFRTEFLPRLKKKPPPKPVEDPPEVIPGKANGSDTVAGAPEEA